tara:strand:- start:17762 stop:17932 length:171 start_codon:yes stop_codon:yes gene_type:complete
MNGPKMAQNFESFESFLNQITTQNELPPTTDVGKITTQNTKKTRKNAKKTQKLTLP